MRRGSGLGHSFRGGVVGRCLRAVRTQIEPVDSQLAPVPSLAISGRLTMVSRKYEEAVGEEGE